MAGLTNLKLLTDFFNKIGQYQTCSPVAQSVDLHQCRLPDCGAEVMSNLHWWSRVERARRLVLILLKSMRAAMKVVTKKSVIAAALTAAAISFPDVALAQRAQHAPAADGSSLPFPPVPSASVAAETLQESKHQRRVEPSYLPKDAPNIVIILLDDVGFGLPDTFGGPIHTPTLSRLANEGVSYNTFHTTSICSPTRAALLTGRNQTRVGSGTIAERAVDWDGYTGVIPRTSATLPRSWALTGTRLPLLVSGTTRLPPKPPPWGRSIVADRRGYWLRLFLRLPCR